MCLCLFSGGDASFIVSSFAVVPIQNQNHDRHSQELVRAHVLSTDTAVPTSVLVSPFSFFFRLRRGRGHRLLHRGTAGHRRRDMDGTGKDASRCGVVGDSGRVSVEFGCSFISPGYGGHDRWSSFRWVFMCSRPRSYSRVFSDVYQIVYVSGPALGFVYVMRRQ